MTAFNAHDLTASHTSGWASPANAWPLDRTFAAELDRELARRRPKTIVEVGSGVSTLVLASYAEQAGARVISLEHEEEFAKRTHRLLDAAGLLDHVDIHLRPLTDPTPERPGPWYAMDDLPEAIDFVLIDGPPERAGGRAGVLPALWSRLSEGAVMMLDDADRPGEVEALGFWVSMYGEELTAYRPGYGKNGALVLGRGIDVRPEPFDADDVAVTILTGHRPHLLVRLVDSLRAHAPGLLESAHVIALHNRAEGDALTSGVLDSLGGSVVETTSLYPIGRAVSLLENATRKTGAKYWLHLEDDWELVTGDATWLDTAQALLDGPRPSRPAQVRLRHWTERFLARHMVTGKPIKWVPDTTGPFLLGDAHLTFNPTLSLVGGLTGCFPVQGERDFMTSAHAFGMRRVAHLYPGAFAHTGDGGESLRRRVERRQEGE